MAANRNGSELSPGAAEGCYQRRYSYLQSKKTGDAKDKWFHGGQGNPSVTSWWRILNSQSAGRRSTIASVTDSLFIESIWEKDTTDGNC